RGGGSGHGRLAGGAAGAADVSGANAGVTDRVREPAGGDRAWSGGGRAAGVTAAPDAERERARRGQGGPTAAAARGTGGRDGAGGHGGGHGRSVGRAGNGRGRRARRDDTSGGRAQGRDARPRRGHQSSEGAAPDAA